MITKIKNITTFTAEDLFGILKTDFADYLNEKLDAAVTVDFAHVYDIIDVSFPEIIDGVAFFITVSEDEITVSANNNTPANNSDVLEKQLTDFLKLSLN